MAQYLILCVSLTNAQRGKKLLEQAGISSAVVKAPLGLSTRGCGYGLSLYRHFPQAVALLKEKSLLKGKVFMKEDGQEYREVKL